MPKPLFTSFYTPDYTSYATTLTSTLDTHGLQHDCLMAPAGNNGKHKPAHLLMMRDRYPGQSIVWVDADAQIKNMPTLFDTLNAEGQVDFAAYWHHGSGPPDPTGELFSGTLYFAATRAADDLIKAWQKACVTDPRCDQQVLQDLVIEAAKRGLRWQRLSCHYCFVETFMLSAEAIKHGQPPIISQGMASMKAKR